MPYRSLKPRTPIRFSTPLSYPDPCILAAKSSSKSYLCGNAPSARTSHATMQSCPFATGTRAVLESSSELGIGTLALYSTVPLRAPNRSYSRRVIFTDKVCLQQPKCLVLHISFWTNERQELRRSVSHRPTCFECFSIYCLRVSRMTMFLFLYECGGMEITMLGAEEACIPGALPCCFAGTSPWRVGRHRSAYSFFILQVIALAGRKEGVADLRR